MTMAPRIAARAVEMSAQVHHSYSGRCLDHEDSSSDEEDVRALRRQAKEASGHILRAGKAHGAIVRRTQAKGPLSNLMILQQALEVLEDIVSRPPPGHSLSQKRLPAEVMDTSARTSKPAAAFAPDRPATTPTKPTNSKSVVSRPVRRQSTKASSSFADMCSLETRTHRNAVASAEDPVLRAQMAMPPSIGEKPHEPAKKSHSMSKKSPRVLNDAKHALRASTPFGASEGSQTALCFHMAGGDDSHSKAVRESSLTRGYEALDAKHFALDDDSDTDSGIKSNIANVYDALANPQSRFPQSPTSPRGYTLPPLTPPTGRRSGKNSRTTSPSMLSAMEIDLCSSRNTGNSLVCRQSSSLDREPVSFSTEHHRHTRSCGSLHSPKVASRRETNITLPALPTSKAKKGISLSSTSGLKLRSGSVEPSLWCVSPNRNILEYNACQLAF